jgi:hypothetical protein
VIEIDDDGAGIVEIWLETNAGRWILLARGDHPLPALIDAERLIRAELESLQARLHAERQRKRSA